MWSLGAIVYLMLSGQPPFRGYNDNRVMSAITAGDFEFDDSEWVGITEDSQDFIKTLLQKDPSDRPSAGEALNHPWLSKMQEADPSSLPNLTDSVARLTAFRMQTRLR